MPAKTKKTKAPPPQVDSENDDSSSEATPVKKSSSKKSPKASPKASPKKSPKAAPKASPKKSPKAAPKKAPKRKREDDEEPEEEAPKAKADKKKAKKEKAAEEPKKDDKSKSKKKRDPAEEEGDEPQKAEKAKSKKAKTDDDDENEADDAKPALHVDNFDLSPSTKKALKDRGIEALFPIQAATFQEIRQGRDVIGRARTGCGKTLAFALPIVEQLLAINKKSPPKRGRAPACLVLAPTRELASQVGKEFSSVSQDLEVLCVYGGAPMGPQCKALQNGIDVIVGTPGRIIDHLERKTLDLSSRLAHVVLDEADKMLEMGFQEDVNKILEQATTKHQKCLFSATLPEWVRDVAAKHMVDHKLIDMVTDTEGAASHDVRHIAIATHWTSRVGTISDCIGMYAGAQGRVLVFCATKQECNDMCNDANLKYESKPLHGDIAQAHRESTLEAFKNGRFRVLVATDVAARGLDMRVDLVINSKPPESRGGYPETETYVHRSGRTGRAGRKGVCVTLYAPNAKRVLQQIERQTKNTFEWLSAPQPSEVMAIAASTAVSDAADIPKEVRDNFQEPAEELLKQTDNDAIEAIKAMLALYTGNTAMPPSKSILSNATGYVCYQFHSKHSEIGGLGYVWGALRNALTAEILDDKTAICNMQFTADRWGAVFDVREDVCPMLVSQVKRKDWLSIPTTLPDLLQRDDNRGGKKGGKGGSKGGKGGSKGGKGGKGGFKGGKW